jgi:hypothetical protein
MLSVRYYCQILIKKINFLDRFAKKAQMLNVIKIRAVRAKFGRTDGHDEGNTSFSQFCERA